MTTSTTQFQEEEAIASVLSAEQDLREGKVLRGDIRQFVKDCRQEE